MASVCALREYETEETCKKECEFYEENGICSAEYDISFCAYQHNGNSSMNVSSSIEF